MSVITNPVHSILILGRCKYEGGMCEFPIDCRGTISSTPCGNVDKICCMCKSNTSHTQSTTIILTLINYFGNFLLLSNR